MEVINLEKVVHIMNGDKELFEQLFEAIESALPEKYENLEKALREGSSEDLELYAHQFKGALRNVAAEEACSLLEKIEKCGKGGDLELARSLYPGVRPAVERLFEFYLSRGWDKAFG